MNLLILLILSAGFAAIDLGVKQLVFGDFKGQEHVALAIIPGLYLQLVHNTGGLFGLGQGHTGVFILLSAVTMAFVLWMYLSFGARQWLTKLALALILGGAVGNLVDRASFSYVRDFLLIRLGRFQWPNFNVADVWIRIGAAMLLLWMIQHPEPKKKRESESKN